MSDLEQMRQMLNGKVEFTEINQQDVDHYDSSGKSKYGLEVQNSPSNGYYNFISIWLFDRDGVFLKVGHYE